MAADSDETPEIMSRAAAGDQRALGELFSLHRDRLRLMVQLRLDNRLHGRVDPSDVLQETYVEALERFNDYVAKPVMPFYLWLRFLTAQRLITIHRQNLGVKARDAGREVSLDRQGSPEVSSVVLAAELVSRHTTPSHAAMQEEMKGRIQRALDAMNPLDREVLTLRHWEQLSNSEVAQVLDLTESAASQRYGRAVWRLKEILTEVFGESERGK
jgi:RNA polymerase sigma-70 factor (ECF subfamily)